MTQITDGHGHNCDATFSPDGRTLFFVSDRDGNADLFTMPFRPDDPGGADQARNLTRNPAGDFRPAVSPDGKTVAFSSDRARPEPIPYTAEIYVMNRDGSNPRRLSRVDHEIRRNRSARADGEIASCSASF